MKKPEVVTGETVWTTVCIPQEQIIQSTTPNLSSWFFAVDWLSDWLIIWLIIKLGDSFIPLFIYWFAGLYF